MDPLAFLFERKGIFTIKNEGLSIEDLELEMIDAGAADFDVDGDMVTVTLCIGGFRKC